MRYPHRTLAALVLPLALGALGGCASRAELAELRDDVAVLTRAVEANETASAESLSSARLAREEIAAVRAVAERAARDAAASRRTLEAMDARMGGSLGGGTLK